MVDTSGLTADNSKALGKRINYTAKVFILGWMGAAMTESTWMIKSMVLAFTRGQTKRSTRAIGNLVNSMVKVDSRMFKVNRELENGSKANE